ncbi:MAG TPA: PLP-dependent aminotransferase family protein [Polyangiales bacterium]|nr:PLP-dependent aminotransferase family protein [Polyangiales bacterium]
MNPGLSQRAAWAADPPIGALMDKALANPELVSLAAGFVDQPSLPIEATRSAALALLAEPAGALAALQYGTISGCAVLRAQVLERVQAQDVAAGGARREVALDRVLLTAGSNQLLYLLAEALLDPGDIVLCDSPTYFVFMGIVQQMGARAIGIEADASGMRVDALEAALAKLAKEQQLARVKAIYVMSYFDNPRSVSLARERRAAVVRVAAQHSLYVIEDAAYRELRYAGDDLPSLFSERDAEARVIYTGTFSKAFSPGVRVGFGILPESLREPLLALKGNLDFGSPHLNQRLVSEALRLGLFDPHVAELRSLYARKRDAMLAALDAELANAAQYQRPDGGMYVWLQLNDDIDTGPNGPLFARALEAGVLYVPGAYFFPEPWEPPRSAGDRLSSEGSRPSGASPPPTARRCMRLSFGVQSEERIALGIRRLAGVL